MESTAQQIGKRIGFGLVAMAFGISLISCAPTAPQLKKVMEENPDILYGVIQKDPAKFLQVVNEAAQKARAEEEKKLVEKEERQREEEFKSPKQPAIDEARAFAGSKEAPITIIEYSDFQCPYCRRGHNTMTQVLKEFDGKVRVIFKNMPIEQIHPMAMPASMYYEAIALQSVEKATKFKDSVFEKQDQLNEKGEKFLEETAKKVGANLSKLKKDLESDAVRSRIDADREEAVKFGFTGTPGYLVNGVTIKGAVPFSEFKEVIERHMSSSSK